MSLLDFLFPKLCIQCKKRGAYICASCFSYISFADSYVCAVCQRAAVGGITHPVCQNRYSLDGVFPSLVYVGVVKKLIYTFKYPPYITDMRDCLVDLFYEGLIQKELFYKTFGKESIFVPVPLHPTKLRKRGYNQAQKLAEGLGKKFDIPVVDCLERVRNTKTQIGLTKEERQENLKDAFALNKAFVEDMKLMQQVFLVDDVSTSGTTLRECAKVLKKAGVKRVWGITLAHGQ